MILINIGVELKKKGNLLNKSDQNSSINNTNTEYVDND